MAGKRPTGGNGRKTRALFRFGLVSYWLKKSYDDSDCLKYIAFFQYFKKKKKFRTKNTTYHATLTLPALRYLHGRLTLRYITLHHGTYTTLTIQYLHYLFYFIILQYLHYLHCYTYTSYITILFLTHPLTWL